VLECVPNVSEGRRADVIAALARTCGGSLLDVHSDPDHHRSVFTLAGDHVTQEIRSLADAVAERVSIADHDGVHPRLGALDVVPFVALAGSVPGDAVAAAREFAPWLAAAHGVPVFLYGDADPGGRSLPETRRDAFEGRAPDHGPDRPHPTLGATAVGARPPLVAVNCWLDGDDVGLARRVAAAVRERDGGLPGVRALGLPLPAAGGRAQVSMNLVDLAATGLEAAVAAVRANVEAAGGAVEQVELVGLVPAAELERCSAGFLDWAGLTADATIEARLAARS